MVSATALFASTLQGEVKDSKGQPIAGAELRIQSNDRTIATARTDAKGHYASSTVPAGSYRVALFVNGVLKASIDNTRVRADNPTELNFALTGKVASNQPIKKGKHMVYVPAATGSNLGGRWVEVDDQTGAGAAGAEGDHVTHVSGEALRTMQTGGMRGGGN